MLQHLANDVSKQNDRKQRITDAQFNSLLRSLLKIADTFESLATFMAEKSAKVPVLTSFPINMDEVRGLKSKLEA